MAVQVIWNLSYIDFPICLDRVEFEYLNLEWQEALFTEVFDDPQKRMSFVVSNKQLPCNDEYVFVVKAYGVNGKNLLNLSEPLQANVPTALASKDEY